MELPSIIFAAMGVQHLAEELQLSSGRDQARYFPLSKGVYDVKPGLIAFGTDLGNGVADRHLFQIDDYYSSYRNAKLAARGERLGKYYQILRYSGPLAGSLAAFIAARLAAEHPQAFALRTERQGQLLHCRLSGERLRFDADGHLANDSAQPERGPAYASALDALACQLQEDLAVVCRGDGENWLAALHLCFPGYWAAETKIGKDFAAVHGPVPGMERTNRSASEIVDAMIDRGPYVRFVWGLSTDSRLNHHPRPPDCLPADQRAAWQGRRFDPDDPRLFLRVERQVIWGFPQYHAALFTIRTYLTDVAAMRRDRCQRDKLCAALRSMSVEALQYKKLADREAIISWLKQKE